VSDAIEDWVNAPPAVRVPPGDEAFWADMGRKPFDDGDVDPEAPTQRDWLRWIGAAEEPMDPEQEDYERDQREIRRLRRLEALINAFLVGEARESLRLKLVSVRNQLESEIAILMRRWD
jgi:hypothetical protein